MNADELEAGDTIEIPTGSRLVVMGVAPASESPESARDGPLYECDRSADGEDVRTLLYGPYNVRQGVAAGAEYAGRIDVDAERRPFWCEGCDIPHRAEERHEAPLTDADVCSYGCARTVESERARRRIEGAEGR